MINQDMFEKAKEFIAAAGSDVINIPDEYFHAIMYIIDKAEMNQRLIDNIEKYALDKTKKPEDIVKIIGNEIINDKYLNR